MTEPISGTPEVGGESVPDAGTHGGAEAQSEPFAPASEGSDVGVEPGAPDTFTLESEPVDPGPSPEMISALAATEIPENLAEHWDHDGALRLYHEALAEGVAPETVAKLMNSWSKGQSERLPQMIEAAQEQADAQTDEAAAARAAQSRRALQHEWRDSYEAKIKTARDVAANLLGHDEVQRLTQIRLADGSLFGDSPTLIKMLAKLGGHMALESSAQLAQQELDELEMDDNYNKHIFDMSDTPGRRSALEKRQRLFERAYPEEAPTQAEPVTAEAKAAAKAELKQYADVKGLGQELTRAMSNLEDPRDRSDKDRQTLARWGKANRIAEAPVVGQGASVNQMSRAEAQAEIAKLEKNPELWTTDVAVLGLQSHRSLVARRNQLYKIAYD
ncbi:MAG: hypothetical protein IH974_01085 [Myxococcales bacterium]|nr:hypothetical protein [Myxococcales bacterium]